MFNPLVDSFDSLSDNEIEQKCIELGRKYWQARNPQLQSQVAVILEMYKQELQSRRAKEKITQQQDQDDKGLDNLINIS